MDSSKVQVNGPRRLPVNRMVKAFPSLRNFLKRAIPRSALVRAGYYLFRGQRTYSGSAEDLFLARLFGKTRGFYVDVGAFHPKILSNTYGLWKAGWRGLNIDVDSYKIDLFKSVRPNDISVVMGVSDAAGEMEVYSIKGDHFGSMASLNESHARAAAAARGREVETRRVSVKPLNDILAEHLPKGEDGKLCRVDLINIDIEGHEMAVLSSFDFERYGPRCFLVEIHGDSVDSVASAEVTQFLKKNGYQMIAWLNPTAMFEQVKRQWSDRTEES